MSYISMELAIAGAAVAIMISILAPFLASLNADGLDKNLITLVGEDQKKKLRK